mgnify:CR=1
MSGSLKTFCAVAVAAVIGATAAQA